MQALTLKARIVEAGHTQRSLAAAIGMSENTMTSRLCGKSSFTTDEALRICEALGITDDADKAFIFLH